MRSPDVRMGDISTRAARWIILLIVIAAFALRLLDIDRPLWFDEVATTEFAKVSAGKLWSMWMVRETNPPLYYTLVKVWTSFAGESDIALRVLSNILMTGSAFTLFWVVQLVHSRRAALAAALIQATAPAAFIYGQQVRAYALCQLAAIAAICCMAACLIKLRDGKNHVPALIGYSACSIIAVYSHTTMVLLPVLCGLSAVLIMLRLRLAKIMITHLALAHIAIVIAWSWWGYMTLLQGAHPANISAITRIGPWEAITTTIHAYGLWSVKRSVVLAISGVLFVLGAASLRRSVGLILPVCALGLPICLFALSYITPVFVERTVYWGSTPFLGTIACGIWSISRKAVCLALTAAWAMSGTADVLKLANEDHDDYRDIVAALRVAPAGSLVISNTPFALRRYCGPDCPVQIVGVSSHWMNEAFAAPVVDLTRRDGAHPISFVTVDRASPTLSAAAGMCAQTLGEWNIPAEPTIRAQRWRRCGS